MPEGADHHCLILHAFPKVKSRLDYSRVEVFSKAVVNVRESR
jgi:hypothetical protein